jgi:phage replication-related protein YjqB (UPF0714/DUF867 family)
LKVAKEVAQDETFQTTCLNDEIGQRSFRHLKPHPANSQSIQSTHFDDSFILIATPSEVAKLRKCQIQLAEHSTLMNDLLSA